MTRTSSEGLKLACVCAAIINERAGGRSSASESVRSRLIWIIGRGDSMPESVILHSLRNRIDYSRRRSGTGALGFRSVSRGGALNRCR